MDILDCAKASRVEHALGGIVVGSGGNVLAREVGEKAGVSAGQRAGATEAVGLAGVAEIRGAGRVATREELTSATGLERCLDVLEDAALDNDLGASAELKRMSLAVVPVVVDRVKKGVAANLGGPAGHVVDEVVLEGDHLS